SVSLLPSEAPPKPPSWSRAGEAGSGVTSSSRVVVGLIVVTLDFLPFKSGGQNLNPGYQGTGNRLPETGLPLPVTARRGGRSRSGPRAGAWQWSRRSASESGPRLRPRP